MTACAGAQERRELAKQFSSGNRRSLPEELENGDGGGATTKDPVHTTISRFMPTSRRIVQFSDGVPPRPDERVVYIDGGFDLFHPGHVEILKVTLKHRAYTFLAQLTDTFPFRPYENPQSQTHYLELRENADFLICKEFSWTGQDYGAIYCIEANAMRIPQACIHEVRDMLLFGCAAGAGAGRLPAGGASH
jgi:hypothetical protein